jgi:hypothetical protein
MIAGRRFSERRLMPITEKAFNKFHIRGTKKRPTCVDSLKFANDIQPDVREVIFEELKEERE